jgi:hypothetical protein
LQKRLTKVQLRQRDVKRNAFMLCAIHRSLNMALTDYKQRMCGADANYAMTLNVMHH